MAVVIREFFTRWGFQSDMGAVNQFASALSSAKGEAVAAGVAASLMNGKVAALAKGVALGAVKVLKMFSAIQTLKNITLGAVAAFGALTVAFFRLAGETAKSAQKAELYAKALGLTPQGLQEWEFALQRTGGSINAFKNGIATLVDAQLSAKEGSEAATEAFEKLGVPIKKLKDAKPEELFLAVSDGIKKMKNPTEIMARLIRLFGKEVAIELEGSLLKGRAALEGFKEEARDLGLVLTEKDFANAKKFTEAFAKLKNQFAGFKQLLGKELLPVFTEFLEAKGEFSPEDRKDIIKGIVAGARAFSKALRVAIKVSRKFQKMIRGLIDAMGGFEAIIAQAKIALLFFITFQVVSIVTGFILLLQGLLIVIKANTGGLGLMRLAMIAFGKATFAVFVKLVIVPAIITAIIVLILLLLEDIKVFSEGGKSAIGDFLNEFPEIERALENFEAFVHKALFSVVEAFDDMVVDVKILFQNLTKDGALSAWLDLLAKDVDRTLEDLTESFERFAKFLEGLIPDSVADALGAAQKFLSSSPASPEGTGSDVLLGLANDSRRRGPDFGATNARPAVNVQGGPTTIHVTQKEGESGEQFAKRVVRLQADEARKMDTKRAAAVMTPVFDR